MIEVRSEGTEFLYLRAKDADSGEGREYIRGLLPATHEKIRLSPDQVKSLQKGIDTRMVLFRSCINPVWLQYWLVWQTPVDLVALDERVCDGTYTDDDFTPSFRTSFDRLWCEKSRHIFPTLTMDGGDAYPNAWTLHREKLSRLEVLRCPLCSSSFRQLVAKVMEW